MATRSSTDEEREEDEAAHKRVLMIVNCSQFVLSVSYSKLCTSLNLRYIVRVISFRVGIAIDITTTSPDSWLMLYTLYSIEEHGSLKNNL